MGSEFDDLLGLWRHALLFILQYDGEAEIEKAFWEDAKNGWNMVGGDNSFTFEKVASMYRNIDFSCRKVTLLD